MKTTIKTLNVSWWYLYVVFYAGKNEKNNNI